MLLACWVAASVLPAGHGLLAEVKCPVTCDEAEAVCQRAVAAPVGTSPLAPGTVAVRSCNVTQVTETNLVRVVGTFTCACNDWEGFENGASPTYRWTGTAQYRCALAADAVFPPSPPYDAGGKHCAAATAVCPDTCEAALVFCPAADRLQTWCREGVALSCWLCGGGGGNLTIPLRSSGSCEAPRWQQAARCSGVCGAHGCCSPDGGCQCASDDVLGYWEGPRCDTCQPRYSGPSCTQGVVSLSGLFGAGESARSAVMPFLVITLMYIFFGIVGVIRKMRTHVRHIHEHIASAAHKPAGVAEAFLIPTEERLRRLRDAPYYIPPRDVLSRGAKSRLEHEHAH